MVSKFWCGEGRTNEDEFIVDQVRGLGCFGCFVGGVHGYAIAPRGRTGACHGHPGLYAERVITAQRPPGPVLEAGCGAGRVLRYYHDRGIDIVGLDFIASVLAAIGDEDTSIRLAAGDIGLLPFPDQTFSAVLAFGLYHGLEFGLEAAMADTRRIMKTDALLCASMRLDNLQNRVTDRMAACAMGPGEGRFHKLNLTSGEFKALVGGSGFEILRLDYVEFCSPFKQRISCK